MLLQPLPPLPVSPTPRASSTARNSLPQLVLTHASHPEKFSVTPSLLIFYCFITTSATQNTINYYHTVSKDQGSAISYWVLESRHHLGCSTIRMHHVSTGAWRLQSFHTRVCASECEPKPHSAKSPLQWSPKAHWMEH